MASSPKLSYLATHQAPPFLEWKFSLHLSYSTEWLALISNMEGSNPITMTEWISPYIWPTHHNGYGSQHSYLTWKEPILSPWQNVLALTSDHGRNQSSHHVRMAMGLITFPWRKPRSREHQASPWRTRTSLWPTASSTHQLSIPPSQHTGASLLFSTPYPWYSDTWSRYDLTCHGTPSSPTTLVVTMYTGSIHLEIE